MLPQNRIELSSTRNVLNVKDISSMTFLLNIILKGSTVKSPMLVIQKQLNLDVTYVTKVSNTRYPLIDIRIHMMMKRRVLTVIDALQNSQGRIILQSTDRECTNWSI